MALGWPQGHDRDTWDMTDDCCYKANHYSDCNCCGRDDGCNGGLEEGDGDCDSDSDCASGLLCGKNNCADFRGALGWPQGHDQDTWDRTDDCCYKGNH